MEQKLYCSKNFLERINKIVTEFSVIVSSNLQEINSLIRSNVIIPVHLACRFFVGVLHLQGYTEGGQQTVHYTEERLRDDPSRSFIHCAM